MRYMGGWSYAEYLDTPSDVIDVIVTRMNRDYEIFGAPVSFSVGLIPKEHA